MAINIGTPMSNAIAELRGNRDFEDLIDAMGEYAQKTMESAISGPPELRVDQTGFARGMFDLWEGFRAAYLGINPAQVKPPPMPKIRPKD